MNIFDRVSSSHVSMTPISGAFYVFVLDRLFILDIFYVHIHQIQTLVSSVTHFLITYQINSTFSLFETKAFHQSIRAFLRPRHLINWPFTQNRLYTYFLLY